MDWYRLRGFFLAPNRLCANVGDLGWPGQRRPEGRRAPEASRGPPGHVELRSALPRPPIPLVGAYELLGARGFLPPNEASLPRSLPSLGMPSPMLYVSSNRENAAAEQQDGFPTEDRGNEDSRPVPPRETLCRYQRSWAGSVGKFARAALSEIRNPLLPKGSVFRMGTIRKKGRSREAPSPSANGGGGRLRGVLGRGARGRSNGCVRPTPRRSRVFPCRVGNAHRTKALAACRLDGVVARERARSTRRRRPPNSALSDTRATRNVSRFRARGGARRTRRVGGRRGCGPCGRSSRWSQHRHTGTLRA